MAADKEALYQQRLRRYVTAMRKGKPDKIPIRPFVAEFTSKYAGFTSQEVTHDFDKAFVAARKCAADFDWDAVVGNMVYVWTGLTECLGIRYYAVPGIDLPGKTAFQYREPSEDDAFMKEDEYDALIEDPTGFLYNVWLPRVAKEMAGIGKPSTYRNNVALVKTSMAMLRYFFAFGDQAAKLRSESGTVSAIAGILKAPFDILADKLRGYVGLTMDMVRQPKKVLEACEALAPHLYHVAKTSADASKTVPIGYWMHRGCVPFVSHAQFKSHYWPTIKPIVQELWKDGHQVLFYAEGNWDQHLDAFAELPDCSIVYHVDMGDIFKVHQKLGHKFCLSGGIPNVLLSFKKPEDVRERVKKVIDEVAKDGGYILDAGAIMQDDTRVENMKAMTDFCREYGVYSSGASSTIPDAKPVPVPKGEGIGGLPAPRTKPGICIPWEKKEKEIPQILGDRAIVQRIWEEQEFFGNMFIWQMLLSF
jgi:uroporphyrinogen-III decarboxylase